MLDRLFARHNVEDFWGEWTQSGKSSELARIFDRSRNTQVEVRERAEVSGGLPEASRAEVGPDIPTRSFCNRQAEKSKGRAREKKCLVLLRATTLSVRTGRKLAWTPGFFYSRGAWLIPRIDAREQLHESLNGRAGLIGGRLSLEERYRLGNLRSSRDYAARLWISVCESSKIGKSEPPESVRTRTNDGQFWLEEGHELCAFEDSLLVAESPAISCSVVRGLGQTRESWMLYPI